MFTTSESFTEWRVLVVEDDPEMVNLVRAGLEERGLVVDSAGDGREAMASLAGDRYDLVVLDVMLPGLCGFEICRRLRERDASIPVLVITARREEADMLHGFNLGADDYLMKPFSIREFTARVLSMLRTVDLRRQRASPGSEVRSIGPITIDTTRRVVMRDNERIDLTRTEYRLLELLSSSPGRIFTSNELIVAIYGEFEEVLDGSLRRHMSRLRSKIDPGKSNLIRNVPGLGYRLEDR